jgi:hypothetical protein
MLSIGELVEKIVIENIKIFNIREKLHTENLSDEEYVKLNEKMMVLNDNKSIISNILNDKIENVVNKKEKNQILKTIKTY